MRVDGVVVQQVALRVEAHHLAARAEARVDVQGALLPHRRGEQQLPQVLAEHADGLDVSLFLGGGQHLVLDGGVQQALVGILNGRIHLRAAGRGRAALLRIDLTGDAFQRVIGIHFHPHADRTLLLRPQHRQQAVRRDLVDPLREIEIVTIVLGFGIVLLALDHVRGDGTPAGVEVAQVRAHRLAVGHHLGDDVACASEGLLLLALRVVEFHIPELEGQRLVSLFARHGSTGLALGPVRKIEILHGLRIHLVLNGFAKLRRELALLLDAGEDGALALLQLRETDPVVAHGSHLHLVEGPRALLSVAADEGDGRPFFEELDAMLHLPGSHLQLSGDMVGI